MGKTIKNTMSKDQNKLGKISASHHKMMLFKIYFKKFIMEDQQPNGKME